MPAFSGLKRGFIEVRTEAEDVASLVADALTGAFRSAEDALVEFVQTGKFEFQDLVDSVLADITRIAARQFITEPLTGALFGQGGTGGAAGGLAALASSFFGGGGVGAQNGAEFTVPGPSASGRDGKPILLNAEPGERVRVTRPGQDEGTAGGQITVNNTFNVTASDPDAFRRSEGQIAARVGSTTRQAVRRNV